MMSRIVLCAFPDRLTAGLWRMGRIVSCQVFRNDEGGLNQFRQYLLQHKGLPIYLISDAVEEDYRVETMPHTYGAARASLLERKLGQLYRHTLYRTAQFLGRGQGTRRDDIFLLVALSNAESIQPWIMAMEEQEAPLAGVYLLPMVSQFLVERLKLDRPQLLLADWLKSGLRQTFFQNGKLRVSRLAANTEIADSYRNALYFSEIEKTRLYLLSQRLIAADSRVTLLVLAHGNAGEEVCRKVSGVLDIECLSLDTEKVAKQIGLDTTDLYDHPELLYMHMVARGRVPVSLAPEGLTQNYQVYRMRNWLGYAAAAVLVGGLGLSAMHLRDIAVHEAEAAQAKAEAQEYERRYAMVAEDYPETPLSGGDLKIAVDLSKAIAENARTPQALMQVVSGALGAVPEIQLQRLRWKQTDNPDFKDETPNAAADAATGPQAVAAGGLREIGFLDGEIRNFNGDYRAALESVNRLAGQLQKDPRVESATVLQAPVNVSAKTSLQGSTLDAQAQQMPAAMFKLKILLKPVSVS